MEKNIQPDVPPPYLIKAKGRFNGIEGPFYVAGSYAWGNSADANIVALNHSVDDRKRC